MIYNIMIKLMVILIDGMVPAIVLPVTVIRFRKMKIVLLIISMEGERKVTKIMVSK